MAWVLNMKRSTRTFEIDVHSLDEFDYYLSGADRRICYPLDVDIEKGDIFLINHKPKQTACFVARIATEQRFNDKYKIIYLNSIYPV